MKIVVKMKNDVRVAFVESETLLIRDAQSALNLIASVKYETDCTRLALSQDAMAEEFFSLSTRLAGEVMQKLVNYQVKMALLGDFSGYESKALKDFIYECNQGRSLFFVSGEEEAMERLSSRF